MRCFRWLLARLCLLASLTPVLTTAGLAAEAGRVLVQMPGTAFQGGANRHFGRRFHDRDTVNYVYAAATGEPSRMRARFELTAAPSQPQSLFLEAMDDDAAAACRVRVSLNGVVVFEGASGFPNAAWRVRRFALPGGGLKAGTNDLTIENLEPLGALGQPPWFMVASATVAGEGYRPPVHALPEFTVTLPRAERPLPEPLPAGAPPGFRWRGTKGWMWRPEQYLAEIPILAQYRMNFLMNCYTSMCDIEHRRWGEPDCNRWWEPLPEAKKRAYEAVVRACQAQGIEFCFSMNPNLSSRRFADPDRPEDVESLWQHYHWMQRLGVRWFNVSLDDISQGIDAARQARLVNALFRRLRNADPQAQMIFCPTFYWGDGRDHAAEPYLRALAAELDRDVYVFWTGDQVVTPRITRRAAASYREAVGHRLFLWDNYPVNDNQPTLNLGPVSGRDADLGEVIEGYMSNPLCPQNEINRLPLLTCADYAWNPRGYDPARSIGQAIWHLTADGAQREALRGLVEAYPGMLFFGQGTGFNPARESFQRAAGDTPNRQEQCLRRQEQLRHALKSAFGDRLRDAQETVTADAEWMKTNPPETR